MITTEKKQQLQKSIDAMPRTKILVIGDIMLDEYVWSQVKRISPEAPVPIASVTGVSYFLGGAANVANNARALDAEVTLMGVVGDDSEGEKIYELLKEKGIEYTGVCTESKRHTSLKRRIVSGTQQLLRIDREAVHAIDATVLGNIEAILEEKIRACDVVIISDYCKGLFSDSLVLHIKAEAKRWDKKIFVDSKNRHFLHFKDVYLIKPNKEEAESFAGERFTETYSNLESIGKKLTALFNANIVITLGKDGTALFTHEQFLHKETRAQQVFDVSGAGDTVLAVIATAVAAGAQLEDAVDLSNIAAGHVISHLGTTVCNRHILEEGFHDVVL